MSERTMRKLGFELKKPSLFYRINGFANFIDLIWMYSASQGRFAIPKIWNAHKVSISGNDVVQNKTKIQSIHTLISKQLKIYD